jgi:hypothetical protein
MLRQDPEKNRPVQTIFPTMTYEITSFVYDNSRKQNSLLKNMSARDAVSAQTQYVGVPYDLNFTMSIFTRNADDAFQIVEQILPIFNPDFNISVNLQSEMGIIRDIPIILNGVNQNIEYEGDFSKSRFIEWTLDFTMKVYFYGPITTSKIIKTAFANTWLDPTLSTGYINSLNLGTGNGVFKMEDIVFQGSSYKEATAYAVVIDWDANNKILKAGSTQGSFVVNNTIQAVSTNASYIISSFDVSPIKLASQKIEVSPLTANIGDPFGYFTETKEWPNA